MSTIQERLAALAGKSPDEIAEFLKSQGITGYISVASSCPLANYLAGDTLEVLVSQLDIAWLEKHEETGNVATPENLAEFVKKFDQAEYPELLAVPWETS